MTAKRMSAKKIAALSATGVAAAGCGVGAGFLFKQINICDAAASELSTRIFKIIPSDVFDLPGFREGLLNFTASRAHVYFGKGVSSYQVFSFIKPNNLQDIIKACEYHRAHDGMTDIYGNIVKAYWTKSDLMYDFSEYVANYIGEHGEKSEWMTKFLEAHKQQDVIRAMETSARSQEIGYICGAVFASIIGGALFILFVIQVLMYKNPQPSKALNASEATEKTSSDKQMSNEAL